MTSLIRAGQDVMATKGADQQADYSGSKVVALSRTATTAFGPVTVACRRGTITIYHRTEDGPSTTLKYTCTVESDTLPNEQMKQGLAEMLQLVTDARTANRDEAEAKLARMEEVLDAATAWLTTKGSTDGLITVDAAFPKRPGQCYITFSYRQICENLMQWASSELPLLIEIIESQTELERKIHIQPANRHRRTPMTPMDVLRSVKHLPKHLLA
jgi:hypothetical protein